VFCPKFNGDNPVIWKDKCVDYFFVSGFGSETLGEDGCSAL
jgi:hypothetical protein